ncbi:MAG: GNAT family N-acetyltransferase [Aeromicrobium sp.]
MLWRVRTTLADRPGILADIAKACGKAEVNILGMQVFPTVPHVTDEFMISTAEGWADINVAELFVSSGGADVSVTRGTAASLFDAPTRWLNGVHQILEESRDVVDMLSELLETEPPDVADYAGHDVLQLVRRNGSTLSVSRAVPFTTIERARAQALVSLVGDAGSQVAALTPTKTPLVPVVRESRLSDLDAVADMHERCSADTMYSRYQTPLAMPMATRFVRRLVQPDNGLGLVIQIGSDIVGHGTLENDGNLWTFHLILEDAWQGRGLGSKAVKYAAGRAKALGADHLTCITAGSNDRLLRAVGHAGFVARVVRHEGNVHITVPLNAVRAIVVAS